VLDRTVKRKHPSSVVSIRSHAIGWRVARRRRRAGHSSISVNDEVRGCGSAIRRCTNAQCATSDIRGRPAAFRKPYRYWSLSSSLWTITPGFLLRRPVSMLFTSSPPPPLVPERVFWHAASVDDACPSCIIFVSLSLEGFARFSVLSILSVVVRKFCQLGAGSCMLPPDASDAPGESARRPEVLPSGSVGNPRSADATTSDSGLCPGGRIVST
jgi:hypothetical protein